MKKLTTFWAVAALIIAATLILTGCPGRTTGARGATTAGTLTPITFTLFNADAIQDMPFDDPIAREITRRTGVTLSVDRPVGGDERTVVPLMIAAGQYPDMVFAKGELAMLIDAGAILPLDDLIEKRGKHIKTMYGPMLGRLKASVDDPKVYNVGTFPLNNGIWSTDGTMQIQHAVLKELGYPRMRTLQDYENAIREYVRRYPSINGRRTIGYSLLIDSWQWYISLSNPGGFLLGYPDDGQWLVDQNTLEAYYKFLHPEFHNYYRWLNRMQQEGLLDPESFTHTEDEWRAKIATGRVLAHPYPAWGFGDARSALIADGMPERTYAPLPITIDERFRAVSLMDQGFSGGWGIAITTANRDPERAFEFLDWMCSEEAQILTNWGFEGVNYNVVNGTRVVPEAERLRSENDPNYSRITGVGNWVHPFPQYGRGYKDSTGNWITRDSPEIIKDRYLPIERETLAAYGAEMWIDLFPPTSELGVSRHGAAWQYTLPPDLQAKTAEADDYIKTALANAVLGRPENFDAAWQRIMDDLRRMGIDEANRGMTQQVRERVNLWER